MKFTDTYKEIYTLYMVFLLSLYNNWQPKYNICILLIFGMLLSQNNS